MKKLFLLIAILAILSVTACAAPLTDYDFGKATVDLSIQGRVQATMGLDNHLAVNISNLPNPQINIMYGIGKVNEGKADLSLYGGVQSTSGFVMDGGEIGFGAQIGALASMPLSERFTVYANVQLGTPAFMLLGGGSYKMTETLDADLELTYINNYPGSVFFPNIGVTMHF